MDIPEEYRRLQFPEWPLPSDLTRWQQQGGKATRELVARCLGDLPPRPAPLHIQVIAREDHGDYQLERLEFHNGADALVPGILLLPKKQSGPLPVIVGLHGTPDPARRFVPRKRILGALACG